MEVWEEAMVLQDLHKTHSLDQSSLARMTGHSRSWVSRRLSIISKTDEEVSSLIRMGLGISLVWSEVPPGSSIDSQGLSNWSYEARLMLMNFK